MFGGTLYHRIKKSLYGQNKRFFYLGMVLPSVAASDVFGRTDTRIRQKGRKKPISSVFRLRVVSITIGCKKAVKSQLQAVSADILVNAL